MLGSASAGSRMNGVGERERERDRDRERERDRERQRETETERQRQRENDQTGVFAGSGRVWQCFTFYRGFYSLH